MASFKRRIIPTDDEVVNCLVTLRVSAEALGTPKGYTNRQNHSSLSIACDHERDAAMDMILA